ncbi:hypothetical protein NQ176_g5675 [Zarea fungicola]|uniref:Uncharacterized protein n=1 Tax=Zarea fungicola TaxID=93591 RepID=A0ACC1N815_9HYPO|nr:hypothetical protein NQ176_g5675 [Lecanicillium fungicola]
MKPFVFFPALLVSLAVANPMPSPDSMAAPSQCVTATNAKGLLHLPLVTSIVKACYVLSIKTFGQKGSKLKSGGKKPPPPKGKRPAEVDNPDDLESDDEHLLYKMSTQEQDFENMFFGAIKSALQDGNMMPADDEDEIDQYLREMMWEAMASASNDAAE